MPDIKPRTHAQSAATLPWAIVVAIGTAVVVVVMASLAAMQLTRSVYSEAFEAGFYRGQAMPGSARPQRKLLTDRLPQTALPSEPPHPKAKP